MTTTRIALPLSFVVTGAVAACGGAAPTHTGYPEGEATPWDKASKLRLSDNGEASADGTLSFPERQRAKWYYVELPTAGAVTARMTLENRTPGTDVGLEILDAGYNVNAPGESDDDVGQPKKSREYKDARPGKTFVHLYVLGRNDRAEYSLRVHFDPKPQAPRTADEPAAIPSNDKSSFPWTVPNLPAIPQINASDDTPLRGGGKRVAQPTKPEPKPEEPPPDTGPSVKGTITEFSDTGSGIKIVINKGSNANVEQGWNGYVVSGGKPLPKSNFTIKTVRDTESEAVVRVTLDDIQKNHTVVLKPPK